MVYELTLGNKDGLFESGVCRSQDGAVEPLVFFSNTSIGELDSFMCQEQSLEDDMDFPVRWYHQNENELAIYLWEERIQEVVFDNQSDKPILINVDKGHKRLLAPGDKILFSKN